MEIIKLDEKIERLVMYLADAADASWSYINGQIVRLDAEKKKLEAGLEKSRRKKQRRYHNMVFSGLDNAGKNALACAFIEKILVGAEDIEIVWKVQSCFKTCQGCYGEFSMTEA